MTISRGKEIEIIEQDTNEAAHTTRLHFVPLLCPLHASCDDRRVLPYHT